MDTTPREFIKKAKTQALHVLSFPIAGQLYRYISTLIRLLRRRIDIFLLVLAVIYVLITLKHMSTTGYGLTGNMTESELAGLQEQLTKKLPHALVIGVPKSGARALVTFLEMHPNIKVADGQINFFNVPDNFNRGPEWYRDRMPYSNSEQTTMERSVSYFVTPGVAERVHNITNGTAKLILVVRDPVMRAISEYAEIKTKNKELQPFERLAVNPLNGQVNSMYSALRTSSYYEHLEKWLAVFPLNQMHFVDGDILAKNPLDEIRKVETFLEVGHNVTEANLIMNKTASPYFCARKPTTDPGVPDLVKCMAHPKGWIKPAVDPEVIRMLQRYFRPLNANFFMAANRTFYEWL